MSLKQWDIIHSLFILLSLFVFHITGWYWPVAAIAFLSGILLWATQWYTISHLKPAGGYANMLTTLRYVLQLLIFVFLNKGPHWILGLLFMIPVLLDGLDGYLARRFNHITKFGAMFDMEADSLFITLTGIILYKRNMIDAWIFPAVYLRYFYVLLIAVLQLNNIPEKRTRFGPLIAFIMFAGLILEFIFNSTATRILLFTASCMIVLSFIFSFYGVISQRSDV